MSRRTGELPRADATSRRMGAALKAVREESGLTQKQVGERYGTAESNIAAYEQGRNRFTVQDLPRLAEAIGVPTPYLSRRLGLCGEDDDLAQALIARFGPALGHTLTRLDMALANIQQGEIDAAILILESISERGERRSSN